MRGYLDDFASHLECNAQNEYNSDYWRVGYNVLLKLAKAYKEMLIILQRQ